MANTAAIARATAVRTSLGLGSAALQGAFALEKIAKIAQVMPFQTLLTPEQD